MSFGPIKKETELTDGDDDSWASPRSLLKNSNHHGLNNSSDSIDVLDLDSSKLRPIESSTSDPNKKNSYLSVQARTTSGFHGSGSNESIAFDRLNFASLKIYGRQQEQNSLEEAFNRLTTQQKKQLVLISGQSGSGKTSLAITLKSTVRKQKGAFVVGKFDQYLRDKPLTGFVLVCEQLCRHLKMLKRRKSGSNVFSKLREEIMIELGTELLDIIQIFPAFEVLLDDSTNAKHTTTTGGRKNGYMDDSINEVFGHVQAETRNRINFAFNTMLRILAKYLSPVVIVLDDVQWADTSSLALLESLLSDHINKNLMVIAIYRSNEVDDSHIFSKLVSDIRARQDEHDVTISDIEIHDLGVSDVKEMLRDLLLSTSEDEDDESRLLELAEVCLKKTGGNAFHLIHYVSMLCDEEYLDQDLVTMKWQWDISKIDRETKSTENIIDILTQTMSVQPKECQLILRYAAFLGSVFLKRTMFVLWKDYHEKVKEGGHAGSGALLADDEKEMDFSLDEGLNSCESAGFIECINDETYRWGHDKLHEAAMNLVPVDDKRRFSRNIAEVLSSKLSKDELDALLFVVVDRFNEGTIPTSADKRLGLAELNLRAAEKALTYSAFESMAKYCERGISMLTSDRWVRCYGLSLKLYSLGAEAEGYLGNVNKMEGYCEEVLRDDDRPLRDRLRAYLVLFDSVANRNRPEEAVQLCLQVLRQYGIVFPSSTLTTTFRILFESVGIRRNSHARTEEEVEQLPMMEDSSCIEQMGLLDKLMTYSYTSKNRIAPLVSYRMLRHTLRYGISKYAPAAFASCAAMVIAILGDIKAAAIYSRYAIMLLDRLDPVSAKSAESRTKFLVHSFVTHWTKPMAAIRKPLLRSYEVGMQMGETESAMYSINVYAISGFVTGIPLAELDQHCRIYTKQMIALKRERAYVDCSLLWQTALILMADSDEQTVLIDRAMEVGRRKMISKPTEYSLDTLRTYQLVIYSFFGKYEEAARLALEKGDDMDRIHFSSCLVTIDNFHRGLSLLSAVRRNLGSREMRTKYLREGLRVREKIKKWVEQGNPNMIHWESLLDAELAGCQGQSDVASKLYRAAITQADRGGFIHDCALANERYRDFLCSTQSIFDSGDSKTESEFRLNEAIRLYRKWGCVAKVKKLEGFMTSP